MIESAHGLVFRTRRFTETSLIISWLTPALGRLSTLAKGALRTKSPFRGKLDLYYEADFSFARSRSSDLHTLREVSLRETHLPLRQDLARLRQAAYAAALVESVTEKETPLPEVFELTRGFLAAICATPPRTQAVFAFEFKLLEELGLNPDRRGSGLSAGSTQIAAALASRDWPAVMRLKLSEAQTAELRQFLQGFMVFHLGRIPKGRNAALGLSG
jgi:DNA repair protein RecO (recombination protein O)